MDFAARAVDFARSQPIHVTVLGIVALLLALPIDVMFWQMFVGERGRFENGLRDLRGDLRRMLLGGDVHDLEALLRLGFWSLTYLITNTAVFAGLHRCGQWLNFWS